MKFTSNSDWGKPITQLALDYPAGHPIYTKANHSKGLYLEPYWAWVLQCLLNEERIWGDQFHAV